MSIRIIVRQKRFRTAKKVLAFCVLLSEVGCGPVVSLKDSKDPIQYQPRQVAVGFPKDSDPSDDFYIARPQYFLSYNNNRRGPNWVIWSLNSDWYGSYSKRIEISSDPLLPDEFYPVNPKDFHYPGYERGHLCASNERSNSQENNRNTYFITNFLLMKEEMHESLWRTIENRCKVLCLKKDHDLLIIAGGVFGVGQVKTNDHGIGIPDFCFKIIVVLGRGLDLNSVDSNTVIYSYMFPNHQYVQKDIKPYEKTVREIELSTGYDFLNNVPRKIQDIIETRKTPPIPIR